MSFFDGIWNWIKNIFSSLEKEWHNLQPEVKNAIQQASGVINAITTNLNATPQFVLDLITNAFPGIDIEKIKAGILEVSKDVAGLQTVPGADIYTTLTNLQAYFKGLGSNKWEQEASTISQKLAAVFAPQTTPFATIVTFIEFVYRTFIKK
jgi:phage-related protein